MIFGNAADGTGNPGYVKYSKEQHLYADVTNSMAGNSTAFTFGGD